MVGVLHQCLLCQHCEPRQQYLCPQLSALPPPLSLFKLISLLPQVMLLHLGHTDQLPFSQAHGLLLPGPSSPWQDYLFPPFSLLAALLSTAGWLLLSWPALSVSFLFLLLSSSFLLTSFSTLPWSSVSCSLCPPPFPLSSFYSPA